MTKSLRFFGWSAIVIGALLFFNSMSPWLKSDRKLESERVSEAIQDEIDANIALTARLDAERRRITGETDEPSPPPKQRLGKFITPAEAKVAGPFMFFFGLILLWMAKVLDLLGGHKGEKP